MIARSARLIAVAFLIVSAFLRPLFGPATPARAAVAQSSGLIPWHPHYQARITALMGLSVDLADGHADLSSLDMHIAGRGPDLVVQHTWDSALAASGIGSSEGLGVESDLTRSMSGAPGSTVTYTDATGARWNFPYVSGAYQSPEGQPWSLAVTGSQYTLTNILTGEALAFDSLGRYTSDTDVYKNSNTLTQGGGGAPTAETNSGSGRALAMGYANGLLQDLQSPLYQSGGASQQGSQQVTYAYTGQLLTGITWGAQTSDQQSAALGYTGNLLTSVATPLSNQTWTISYDGSSRVTSITSPISGTVGQPGYTPAYTTSIQYTAGSTVVTQGAGTPNAIVTTYTLDGVGRATAVTDGLGTRTTTRTTTRMMC